MNDYFCFSTQLVFGPSDPMPWCHCFSKIIENTFDVKRIIDKIFLLLIVGSIILTAISISPIPSVDNACSSFKCKFGSFMVLLYLWWSKCSCCSLHRVLTKITGVVCFNLFFIFNAGHFSHLPWNLSRLPAMPAQVQVSPANRQEQKDVLLKGIFLKVNC